jgi:dUTP pyrophosphatase
MLEVQWRKFHHLAMTPTFAHESDSGADLRWYEDVAGIGLYSGETRRFWLGVGVRLPVGYELQIRPRSSMSAKGILCHFGSCDESYVGQIAAVLTNLSNSTVMIQRGDKVCQGVVMPRVVGVRYAEVDDLGATERGAAGFGSSGVR